MLIIYTVLCGISLIIIQPFSKNLNKSIENKIYLEDVNCSKYTSLRTYQALNIESDSESISISKKNNKVSTYLKSSIPYIYGGIALSNYCKYLLY